MSRPKDPQEEMIGFKEFLESTDNTQAPQRKRVDNLNHEMQSFLEKDANRLDKQISLFEEKTFMLKNFPQENKIIVDLETQIIEEKIKLFHILRTKPNGLYNNLSEILEKHFNLL